LERLTLSVPLLPPITQQRRMNLERFPCKSLDRHR
jgi:hypothetical protein